MKQSRIKLEEGEFYRLLRLSERIELLQARGELFLKRMQDELSTAMQTRDGYFDTLVEKYPELQKDVRYQPMEPTLELILEENETNG